MNTGAIFPPALACAVPGPWLAVSQGTAPLLLSLPHAGADLCGLEPRLASPWLARKDTDWRIDQLYDFAASLGASLVRTSVSRTVIDVNRDPAGLSLYPGQATTELCPTTSFDGEALYQPDAGPHASEVADRRAAFFDPYHEALQAELDRLRRLHGAVVLYDCHSIRSVIPRLFKGTLPVFSLGTHSGASAHPALVQQVAALLAASGHSHVVDGRFKGGYITRHYGQPGQGVHALQMELACRSYLREPAGPVDEVNWPVPYDPDLAAPMRKMLRAILEAAIGWTRA